MDLRQDTKQRRSFDEQIVTSYVNLHDNHLWTPSVELETVRSMHFNAILPKLRALLPRRKYEREVGVPPLPADDQAYSRAYFRLLSVSFSNGLAGLVDFPVPAVLAYLQMRFTSQPISEFMQSLGKTASRSFAESLLKCSIEAGRRDIVDFLLSRTDFGLDANRNIIIVGSERLTLVEFAASCHDLAVAKVLVKYGGDITKTIERSDVLTRWLKSRSESSDIVKDRQFLELARMFFEAGGKVQPLFLRLLMEIKLTDPITQLIELTTFNEVQNLSHEDVIRHSVIRLPPEVTLRIIQIFVNAGTDLRTKEFPVARDAPLYQQSAIDVAAGRGNLFLVRTLHGYGKPYTERTFECAVRSGNLELVRHLITENAVPDQVDTFSCHFVVHLYQAGVDLVSLLQSYEIPARTYAREIHCALMVCAAEHGRTDELASFLQAPILKQMRSTKPLARSRSRALRYAMKKALDAGLENTAYTLLDAGANITEDVAGTTPLLLHALARKHKSVVRGLIEAGAVVNYIIDASQPKSPLMLATEMGDRDIIQRLIRAGAQVDAVGMKDTDPMVPCSALCISVAERDLPTATMLLEAGANVDICVMPSTTTPLSIAVKNQDTAMFQLLLTFGADPTHPSVLLRALDRGHPLPPQLIQALEERYPSNKRKFDPTAVQELIRNKDMPKLRQLLQLVGARIDLQRYTAVAGTCNGQCKGQISETPLGTATRADASVRLEATQILLQYGVDANEVVSWEEQSRPDPLVIRKTALLEAVARGDINLVHLLIKHGADVNQPATKGIGRTPLQQAAESGNYDIVDLLLRNGANVNEGPAHIGGATALQLAAMGGSVGIVELLVHNGADINAPGARVDGRYALEGAAEHGRLEVVKYLLFAGAQIDFDISPCDCLVVRFAKANGHFAVAELLKTHITERRAKERNRPTRLEGKMPQMAPDSLEMRSADSQSSRSGGPSGEEDEAIKPPETYASSSSSEYMCQQCFRRLSNASALARHIRSKHSDRAEHECDICRRTFKRRDVLLRHKQTHTKSGYVRCEHCAEYFRQDYLRGSHLTSDGKCKNFKG